ncbi:MAG TPA: hypothetical protein VJM33_15240 [Microthrixaceae bacterium]|nr:hypothetical protein [Microthrixaceae bacterium]
MSHVTDAGLRSPEVARRLGIRADDVYRLIFDGELDGRPDRDGIVYVSEASVSAYLAGHPVAEQSESDRSVFVPASERLPDLLPDPVETAGTGRDETAPSSAETLGTTGRNGPRRDRPELGPSNS